ncbi:MAG: right-handed parallel beta-helix repeat-containing protein [Candidatus Hermodarchaeota archaeon]
MKISQRNKKIVVLFIIISVSLSLLAINHTTPETEEKVKKSSDKNNDLKSIKTSNFWLNCPPIHIDHDNWSATDLEWIQNKTGTFDDPHIIENVTINGNNLTDCIRIEDSIDFFIIRNCTLYNSSSIDGYAAIYLLGTSNGTIINNNCSNNNHASIYLMASCYNITIRGNYADNLYITNSQYGIYLSGTCHNNTISNNRIYDNVIQGIGLNSQCRDNVILNNTIIECNTGIYLGTNSNNNTLEKNTIEDNSIGIHVYSSYNNTILNNTIEDNGSGIYLNSYSDNNTISKNIIIDQFGSGILIREYCDFNNFSNNQIYNNDNYGVEIGSTNCNNNLFYSNYLIGNRDNALDNGTVNHWNYSFIGNYWDDYTGEDLVPPYGIGDTPYNVSGSANSRDYFPIWIESSAEIIPSSSDNGKSKNDEVNEAASFQTYIPILMIGAAVAIIGISVNTFQKRRKKAKLKKKKKPKTRKVVRKTTPSHEIIQKKSNKEYLKQIFEEERPLEKIAELDKVDLTIVDKAFLSKIDDIDLDEDNKREFIKEILSYSLEEREEFLDFILKNLKKYSEENENLNGGGF